MAKHLDEQVTVFRNRPLDAGPYTFVWMDALTQKVREGGRIRTSLVRSEVLVPGRGLATASRTDTVTVSPNALLTVLYPIGRYVRRPARQTARSPPPSALPAQDVADYATASEPKGPAGGSRPRAGLSTASRAKSRRAVRCCSTDHKHGGVACRTGLISRSRSRRRSRSFRRKGGRRSCRRSPRRSSRPSRGRRRAGWMARCSTVRRARASPDPCPCDRGHLRQTRTMTALQLRAGRRTRSGRWRQRGRSVCRPVSVGNPGIWRTSCAGGAWFRDVDERDAVMPRNLRHLCGGLAAGQREQARGGHSGQDEGAAGPCRKRQVLVQEEHAYRAAASGSARLRVPAVVARTRLRPAVNSHYAPRCTTAPPSRWSPGWGWPPPPP